MIKINGARLDFSEFPNGETKVDAKLIKANAHPTKNTIMFKYETDGDLIKLMFVKNYLDNMGLDAELKIMYMPYSRMDRVEGVSAFTLKDVANFINKMKFKKVYVYEAHSDVTPALLDRCEVIDYSEQILEDAIEIVGFDEERDYVFFPDAGASKRYKSAKKYRHLVGHKQRDFDSGNIESLEVMGKVDGAGFTAIIVDDLCSFGGTFLRSATELKKLGASRIYLVVTHCENSIYKGELLKTDLIDGIFTTDSILNEEEYDDRLWVRPLL
ncbi:ribose-phosphate pyrophosphokinase [Bacillus thuringiensis]|nr:ribose-phosphate pyrophosphokinase [Bacillus thuringiensis]PEV64087.1 ribose-phosphate pyrophosphokinase [Bacillus thuringiensis]